jgi:Fur family ferric uptake transcriptional regulator
MAEKIAQRLRELGYRLTPQRVMIVDAIENSNHHISAEEIYVQVRAKYPHMNISTIYRTMELLKRLGLITETNLGEGKVRYHSADKGHHHHLVCQKCGKIVDLDETLLFPLKGALRERHNFEADLRHLAIFGHCIYCEK